MSSNRPATMRSMIAAAGLVLSVVTVPMIVAPVASAAPTPVQQKPADAVTADVLPTVQTDGVVWGQVMVGNTVYATGDFTTAKSAASDPVQTSTPRSNLLAYDVTTGKLDTSFDVSLNAQGIVLAKSPDGSRVYVGGDFTKVNGGSYRKIVAIDTATGQVISSFKPNLDARVAAIVATDTTVYVAGNLSLANNVARQRFAAFSASDGALLGWAPTGDAAVKAMVMTPDGSKIIAGGQFKTINGSTVYGLAAISPINGSLLPWAATGQVRAYGSSSGFTSLRSDGAAIYGTAYTFGGLPVSGLHEFEGTFSANPSTGQLNWLEDCHGDSYDSYSTGTVVYAVSHAHYCVPVGGFPQTPAGGEKRAMAFSAAATGTLAANTVSGYKNWAGTPSPSLYAWFPDLQAGSYTGQSQAAWSVVGNGSYVAFGGEFPTINGVTQYGLARFATRPTAPGLDGPRAQGSNLTPTVSSVQAGSARIQWQTSWDRDDRDLTYSVVRNSDKLHPVFVKTVSSFEWSRPNVQFLDTGLTPGSTYTYRIYATDGDGNQVQGDLATVTVAAGGSAYSQAVAGDNPTLSYRLDEPSGSVVYDSAGFNDATAAGGVSRGVNGGIAGDSDKASHFSGSSSGYAASQQTTVQAGDAFTLEGWVRTTSTSGGPIIILGNKASGTSSSTDRVLYLDNSGHLLFGVNNGTKRTVVSASTYRDGTWHYVAGTVGADGMALYVDGQRVASRPDTNSASTLTGYWRLGGDSLNGWTSKPNSNYLNADIDEIAVYSQALTPQTIAAHAAAGGKNANLPQAPVDAYGAAVFNDGPEMYWRLSQTSGASLADSSLYAANGGTLSGGYTLNQSGALAGNADPAVKFNGSNAFAYSQKNVINPGTFSEEAWFKTTSTSGGKIIGLGNSQTGTSTSYDRQLYLANNGSVVFGVGSSATLTSPGAYNDGTWHHVVATSSDATGMRLYVDGALVRTGSAVTPLATTGFWRVGGDTTGGSSSRFLNGTIDEVAVYYRVLDAAAVLGHYQIGTATTPNANPTAAFSVTAADLTASVDASASSDPDGSISSYSWNWGDGSAAGTGATASHSYTVGGTFTVALTVTDNRGGTSTVSHDVTVAAPNQDPTAEFSSTVDHLDVSVDASGAADPDGTIASYSWNWGDGSAAGTGATATHTYTAAGDFVITLTVTDNRGGTATVDHGITTTEVPNSPPTAAFTSQTTNRTVTVDGSTSTDPDGTIASYSWNWGDGSAFGTGANASHSYLSNGTYTIALTVTDNKGATGTISHDVTVSGPIASDAFQRTIAGGWGAADSGGTWTLTGGASKFSVDGSVGRILMSAAGSGPSASLNDVSARDLDGVVDFGVDKAATGGGVYTTISTRRNGTSSYQFTTKLLATGDVTVAIARVDNGTSTSLGTVTVAGLAFTPGDVVRTRFQVSGTGTTTLAVKAWKVGGTEPATFALTRTDTTAGLQVAGQFAIQAYLSGSATNAPVTASLDNLGLVAFNG